MSEKENPEEKSVPFFPDHVTLEAKVALGFGIGLIIIGIIGLSIPVGLGDPADPMNTPLHIKPEWYFLSLYQLLKYIPKTVGALTPVIGVVILALWPFLDHKPDKSKKTARNRFIIVAVLVIIVIILTILGEVT